MKTRHNVTYLFLAVLFNVIFYLLWGVKHTSGGWISYGFVHIALVVSWISSVYCANYKRIPENLASIYGFAWLYSIISIILNAFFIAIDINNFKLPLLINLALLVVYVIQLMKNISINEEVEKNLETTEYGRQYVNSVSSMLKVVLENVSDVSNKKNIEKAYDIVRTSQIRGGENVNNIESEVVRLTSELYNNSSAMSVAEIDKCAKDVISMANKRNLMIKN